MKIKVRKLVSHAKLPNYANEGDAGMDIYSSENIEIKPNHRALVKTGISMSFPRGYVALVWDKSGIAKNGLTKIGGVIDADYRGEYKIMIHNISSKPYNVQQGQKIAQILVQPVVRPRIEEVDNLDETRRGQSGFGSTGLK